MSKIDPLVTRHKLVTHIKKHGSCRACVLAKAAGLSISGAYKILNGLCDIGVLKTTESRSRVYGNRITFYALGVVMLPPLPTDKPKPPPAARIAARDPFQLPPSFFRREGV